MHAAQRVASPGHAGSLLEEKYRLFSHLWRLVTHLAHLGATVSKANLIKLILIAQIFLKTSPFQPQRVPYDVYANTNNPRGVKMKSAPTNVKILRESPLYSLLWKCIKNYCQNVHTVVQHLSLKGRATRDEALNATYPSQFSVYKSFRSLPLFALRFAYCRLPISSETVRGLLSSPSQSGSCQSCVSSI